MAMASCTTWPGTRTTALYHLPSLSPSLSAVSIRLRTRRVFSPAVGTYVEHYPMLTSTLSDPVVTVESVVGTLYFLHTSTEAGWQTGILILALAYIRTHASVFVLVRR